MLFILIDCIKNERYLVLVQTECIYHIGQMIICFAFLFYLTFDFAPADSRVDHERQDVYDSLHIVDVLLKEECPELAEVLLLLEATDTLLLIFLDLVHFRPNGALFGLILVDFLLLFSL